MAPAPGDLTPKRILVPLDGSDSSLRAARYAINIAKMARAQVICVHAVVNTPYLEYKGAGLVIARYLEEAKRHAEMWYDDVREMAAKDGIDIAAETVLDVASTADAIVNYAERKKADLIVIGTKGRSGLKRFLLGSVASGVVSHARCSVLVVR
jgi:nucleotide-binding universal stress UspA family protein